MNLDFPTEYHVPVLLEEVIEGLHIQAGRWYIDGTLGGGGHTLAMLRAGAKVLGIDQDQEALAATSQRLAESGVSADTYRLAHANFADLESVVAEQGVSEVAGVLLDLGVSSHQLDSLERGFSFNSDTLDMRMDTSQPVTAADMVATLPESDLAILLADLGEERYAKRFAKAIVEARQEPIVSGRQLAEVIYQASPAHYRHGSLHPATRSFQALRLAVNNEMGSLAQVLPQAWLVLAPAGRLAVISFHSLEDRQVKQFMRQKKMADQATLINDRPIEATEQEKRHNLRSRSAKLRIMQKVSR